MNQKIKYQNNIIAAHLVESKVSTNIFTVLLSGSSKSIGMERYFELQDILKEKGNSSITFDYIGSGLSTGEFSEGSLEGRIKETVFIIDWLKNKYGKQIEINLVGPSMGAYVVLGLANISKSIKKVLLICPAAYSKSAHDINFGELFTQELRKPGSWQDSLSYQWANGYKGSVLMITAENDAVVSKDITGLYVKYFSNNKKFAHKTILNAGHGISALTSSDLKVKEHLLSEVLNFLIS